MTEREYKFLLPKEQFYKMLEKAKTLYGTSRDKTQINHYYDDEVLSLNHKKITVRIRESGGMFRLQIKSHGKTRTTYTLSEEREHETEAIPEEIALSELGNVGRKGCLVTRRNSFSVCPGVSLDMDENTYLGLTDYEAEIEFEANMQSEAKLAVSALGLAALNAQSKSARFFAALERMKSCDV